MLLILRYLALLLPAAIADSYPCRGLSAHAAGVNHAMTCVQVAFGAYAEPKKQAEAMRNKTFKIALVASDCLLLGEPPDRCAANSAAWAPAVTQGEQQLLLVYATVGHSLAVLALHESVMKLPAVGWNPSSMLRRCSINLHLLQLLCYVCRVAACAGTPVKKQVRKVLLQPYQCEPHDRSLQGRLCTCGAALSGTCCLQ